MMKVIVKGAFIICVTTGVVLGMEQPTDHEKLLMKLGYAESGDARRMTETGTYTTTNTASNGGRRLNYTAPPAVATATTDTYTASRRLTTFEQPIRPEYTINGDVCKLCNASLVERSQWLWITQDEAEVDGAKSAGATDWVEEVERRIARKKRKLGRMMARDDKTALIEDVASEDMGGRVGPRATFEDAVRMAARPDEKGRYLDPTDSLKVLTEEEIKNLREAFKAVMREYYE